MKDRLKHTIKQKESNEYIIKQGLDDKTWGKFMGEGGFWV